MNSAMLLQVSLAIVSMLATTATVVQEERNVSAAADGHPTSSHLPAAFEGLVQATIVRRKRHGHQDKPRGKDRDDDDDNKRKRKDDDDEKHKHKHRNQHHDDHHHHRKNHERTDGDDGNDQQQYSNDASASANAVAVENVSRAANTASNSNSAASASASASATSTSNQAPIYKKITTTQTTTEQHHESLEQTHTWHNHRSVTVAFEAWHEKAKFTFTSDVGREACGRKVDYTKDWVVAVGPMYWTAEDPKNDPICDNHCIVLETAKKKQVMLLVHDICDRCSSNHINLSKIAFDQLGESASPGEVQGARWKFVRCDPAASKMPQALKDAYFSGKPSQPQPKIV